MKNDNLKRLFGLRNELAQIQVPEYPNKLWPIIQSWVAKATPIIRHDWPEHVDDFQKVTAKIVRARVVSYITDRSGITFQVTEQEARRQLAMDNAEATEVQQKALHFLDGLLTLSPDENVSSTLEKGGDNRNLIMTIITVVGAIIVAIIGSPIVSRLVEIYFPVITSTPKP